MLSVNKLISNFLFHLLCCSIFIFLATLINYPRDNTCLYRWSLMKSDGLTFMLHARAIKGEDGPSTILSKQRQRLYYIPFLLFAMISSLGLLTSRAQHNNPWMQICSHFCCGGDKYHKTFHCRTTHDDRFAFLVFLVN